MRKQYGRRDSINSTPVPETEVHDGEQTVDLKIEIEEGSEFRVGIIGLSGHGATSSLAQNVLANLSLKPGDVYNPLAIEDFFAQNRSWLPDGSEAEQNVEMAQNPGQKTVDLYFVFK